MRCGKKRDREGFFIFSIDLRKSLVTLGKGHEASNADSLGMETSPVTLNFTGRILVIIFIGTDNICMAHEGEAIKNLHDALGRS